MTVAATFLIAVAMVGFGLAMARAAGGRTKEDPLAAAYALVAGWALVSLVGAVCALAGLSLTVPMAVAGLAGLVLFARHAAAAGRALRALALAWLLLAPLLVFASLIPPTAYDEFSHWIPNARYLIAHDAFPTAALPNIESAVPGYPPASPLVGYLAGRLVAGAEEYAPKIFTVLLAGAFALTLAERLSLRGAGVLSVAAGVLLATLFNPFFDPRIALTSYTDTPTAFVLALCMFAAWKCVEEGSAPWAMRMAGAALALVLMRESNVALVGVVGLALVLLRGRLRDLLALALPAFVGAAVWRSYLMLQAIGTPLAPRPLAEWDFNAPLTVARVLLTERLAARPVLGIAGGAVLVALVVLVYVARARITAPVRRLLLIAGLLALLWTLFLAWNYAAVFAPGGASIALSAWRYWGQVGPTLMLATVALLAGLGRAPLAALAQRLARSAPRTRIAMGALACALPLVLLAATQRHWRHDCQFPDVAFARQTGLALRAVDLAGARLTLVHPAEPAWYANVVGYELRKPFGWVLYAATREETDRASLLLDMSAANRSGLLAGRPTPVLQLERWSGSGWQAVRALAAPGRLCVPLWR